MSTVQSILTASCPCRKDTRHHDRSHYQNHIVSRDNIRQLIYSVVLCRNALVPLHAKILLH